MRKEKKQENILKVIEALLFICLIVTLIKLPKILNNGVTMSSINSRYEEIFSNFYLPIFIDVLLIISIVIVLWKSIVNTYFKKEKPNKSLHITFTILALLTLVVTFNSYRTTYRELEDYNYLVYHTQEEVKNVTLHIEELKGDSPKYFVVFAEGAEYEVSKNIYYSIKRGFNNGSLDEDVSYAVPSHYSLVIEFLTNGAGMKTEILSAKINYGFTW